MPKDKIFWAIKFYVEDIIKQQGENIPIPYQTIEEFAFKRFNKKEKSTLRAKCRTIWCFYNKKDWVIENYEPPRWNYKRKMTQKEYEMTRKENIIKINKLRAIDKKKKVEQAIESLKFLNERISVRKVAEYAKVSTKTAQKYLKELKEEGLI